MKKNIAEITVFVAILLAIMYSLDGLLMHGLRTVASGEHGDWNRIRRGEASADILITGASRAMMHYDAPLISSLSGQKCFNIGFSGTGLAMQYPMLLQYLKYSGNPKVVIDDLVIKQFADLYETHHMATYVPYLSENEVYNSMLRINPTVWRNRYLPLYSFSQFGEDLTVRSLRSLLKLPDNDTSTRYDGYQPTDAAWTAEFDTFKAAHPNGLAYKIRHDAVARFEEQIRALQARGIAVILVYSPEYYEDYALTLNRTEIFRVFETVAKKYTVPFWDYTGIPLSYSKEYFTNSQHLNRAGATEFSRMFAVRLRQYMDEKGLRDTSLPAQE